MPIILNEVKQAQHIIAKGKIGNKPTSTLFLLGKYYRQKENFNREVTFLKLNDFMQQHYKNYNSALWEDIIENISKKADKYSLREIEFIGITQNEMDKISETENLKYQQLLFTMLCYAKLYNLISENNNGWVNTSIPELFKIARVSTRYKKDKFLYLNDLEKAGFLSFSNKNNNLNIQITFVDMIGTPVFHICDFRELGYEYLNYIGNGKFIRCSECKQLVKKTNNKCLYCNTCAKEIKNNQNKKYYQKHLGK
ncbi:MAG: hypothetical protein HFI33_02720 [Lachnospiraceae bacterium]|nr:hypothetical protein [Lachnospiraceae bacterium]